jgi:hypothetical protein
MPTYGTIMGATTTKYCLSSFPHKQFVILYAVSMLTLGFGCQLHSSDVNIQKDSSRKVGGPCEYKDYKGIAEIVSVQKEVPGSDSTSIKKPDESYEVRYSFYPENTIQEIFAQVESRYFILLLPDSSYPDLEFIRKNDITPGKRLDCVLNVITKGACTPMIFTFPTLK